MKKLLLSLSLVISVVSGAQTATNFNTNDCAGINHDLFTELNAGKVVVVTWVMPCVNCVNGATSARNAVQSFSASNPGQVVHYVADDYGNSTCTTVNNWCTSNAIAPDAVFTSTSVSMSGYGAAGMPKVVVLGGANHTVYYNVNGSSNISMSGIQSAITNALGTVGINKNAAAPLQVKLSPNPVSNELTISFNAKEKATVEVYSMLGQKVKTIESNMADEVKMNTETMPNGAYFVKITNGKNTETLKFIIAH
jgi:hypothetical protein